MSSVIRVIVAIVVAAAVPTTAPTTSSTGPSSAAVLPADLSSPKAAAKSLFLARSAGDRDGVRAALWAGDEAQARLVDAMADLIVNGKRLGDAARERFGKEGDPIGRGMLDPADLSRLDSATVKPSGPDSATLEIREQNRPMSFRRQEGKWKLVVTDFGGAGAGKIAQQTRLVRGMSDAMDESARELSAGKYKTSDAASSAIQKRLHEVMLNFTRPPTTRAATVGTSEPTTMTTTSPERSR